MKLSVYGESFAVSKLPFKFQNFKSIIRSYRLL